MPKDLPWDDSKGNCYFSRNYYIPKFLTKEEYFLPEFFIRIKKAGDDRSRVIICHLILENKIDKLLSLLIKNYRKKLGGEYGLNFARKVDLLQAFEMIPENIFDSIKCITKIRNEFAHKLYLESFESIVEKKIINKINSAFNKAKTTNNSADQEDIYSKIRQIEFHAIVGLELYETNLELFKNKVNSDKFKKDLEDSFFDMVRQFYNQAMEAEKTQNLLTAFKKGIKLKKLKK